MESRRKRSRKQVRKWIYYTLLLLLCAVLQTTPHLLQFGLAKPLFILPLCIAVAIFEGEFAGGLFAVAGGLLWDYVSGHTVGLLTLFLLILCFFLSIVVQLYLKNGLWNFIVLNALSAWLILSMDCLFFYFMPGYSDAMAHYACHVLPSVALSVPVSIPLFYIVRYISAHLKIEKGIV
jgi:rod shape-determining protein MreD